MTLFSAFQLYGIAKGFVDAIKYRNFSIEVHFI